jgi:hypothetical protein
MPPKYRRPAPFVGFMRAARGAISLASCDGFAPDMIHINAAVTTSCNLLRRAREAMMSRVPLTKAHVADVVRQYAIELRKLALSVGWRRLADLLALAALEADTAAAPNRRKPRRKRD